MRLSSARNAPWTDHWAFGPARAASPPPVRDSARVRTAIDRFIQKALEEEGLTLGPRRRSHDLDPPRELRPDGTAAEPEEIAAFVGDPEPDAYERLVDRLLASPRYGERWGKYWLDASGYSDSNGYFSADSDRPLAYRYRDYVIRAFNADRPLDQIVREQLAGDELAGERPGHDASTAVIDQLVATHFLRNGQDGTGESDGNPDEVRADKYAVLEGAIQIIGSSLLGLTLQCAKCHDHKFEPVTQKEYYQLQAILYPAFNVEHWVKPNDRVVIAGPRAEQSRWEAHDKAIDAQIEALKRSFASEPGAAKKEKALKQVIEAVERPATAQPGPDRVGRRCVGQSVRDTASGARRPGHARPEGRAGRSRVLDRSGQSIRARSRRSQARRSTGRRLALARWLTRPGSRPAALLARVLANRIWQHHFGTGLAATSDNLGYTGSPPTHPELLEFLAGRAGAIGLERQGAASPDPDLVGLIGSRARAIRRAAQRSIPTTGCSRGFRSDGSMPRRSATRCSPSPASSTTVREGPMSRRIAPTRVRSSSPNGSPGATRRSVYLQQRRTQITSLLEVFDAPSIVTTCTRRSPSTIPLQSLSLLNSDFVIDPCAEARRAARSRLRVRATQAAATTTPASTRAFQLIVGRAPDRG